MSIQPPAGQGALPSSPPEAWEPLIRLRFLRIEAASGILLLVSAATALVWANSPWVDSYHRIWHTPLGSTIGTLEISRPLEWFVNDVLMVAFFFVVGLEIRRETHHGEISEWRRAALPLAPLRAACSSSRGSASQWRCWESNPALCYGIG